MLEEDHFNSFENTIPMDLGTFHFDQDEDLQPEDHGVASGGGGGGGGYQVPHNPYHSQERTYDDLNDMMPVLPRFGAFNSGLPTLPRLHDETFGGERHAKVAMGTASVSPVSTSPEVEAYVPVTLRVQPYYGEDDEGICHAILVRAGYAGLLSPTRLRQLVSQAIEGGPLPHSQRQPALERYQDLEDFSRPYTRLSMSAYAGPSGLILKLRPRYLVLLACGSEMILIDPRDQPAKPSPSGLPQLMGDGALVMRCRDHLEVAAFIRGHYQTRLASAELFTLTEQPKETSTKEVTQSVESLTLDAQSDSIVKALDEALLSSAQGDTSGIIASLDAALVASAPAVAKGMSTEKRTDRLRALLNDAGTDAIRENPQPLPGQSTPVPEEEKKNPEGKRERTPPTPPAAMGSPVRMASDDEEDAKPKRAKTPPLKPEITTAAVSSAAPSAVVKAERRKSAPKATRTSGAAAAVTVPVASASGSGKKPAVAAEGSK
jgi:hypothetical protein